MSDWENKEDYLYDLVDFYNFAWEKNWSAQHDWDLAIATWNFGDAWYHTYCSQMLDCLQHLIDAVDNLTGTNWGYEPPFAVPYGFEHHAGAGEPLTAKAICEAWAADNFEDRALTIAFIDRQRQLVWNEPFSVKWAATPKV